MIHPSLSDYALHDSSFTADLADSMYYVWKAARWLHGVQGCTVEVPALRIRPDEALMGEYADGGDLYAIRDGKRFRVEVKHRNSINFTSLADFPYDSVIVDVCHAYDNAEHKPVLYLIFSADGRSLIGVRGSTAPHWRRVKRRDNAKQRDREFYEVSKTLCDFWYIGG